MEDAKLQVMVVEDEEMLLGAISKKLANSGFSTVEFTSASGALDYLGNVQKLPNAIWLDYYLKDMNGLEFMRRLKENEAWGNIPVVVVSNSASEDKVNSMVAMGVKEYFLKADHRLEDIVDSLEGIIKAKNGQS